ncbi:hypothetical protein BH23VER1_BH23VER1_07680 [soil metagenome]
MSEPDASLRWEGLRPEARQAMETRQYSRPPLAESLATCGVMAGQLTGDRAALADAWIPGVEIFPRSIYQQNHRGYFGEFARRGQGVAGAIGFWPDQWASARMYAPSAKGFHVHPPHIPAESDAAAWFRRLFLDEPDNFALRPYALEQWDMMFFLQGIAEMILIDERTGMHRRTMRFLIHGDDLPGSHNCAIIIPPGVAHALRTASSTDLVMVYGTSTVFDPANEGRISASVELAPLPDVWRDYTGGT